MFTLQRGVRHDQHVLVILAFVTTCLPPQKLWGGRHVVRRTPQSTPPKIVGVDWGGGGTKSSYTHRLSVSLSEP